MFGFHIDPPTYKFLAKYENFQMGLICYFPKIYDGIFEVNKFVFHLK